MTPNAQQPEPSDCEYYNRVGPGLKAFCTHPEKKRRFCKHAIAAGVCPVGIARPHAPAPGVDHQPGDSRVYRKIRPEVERRIARTATLKERGRIIKLLERLHEFYYDPRPCNRTDNGGLYNDSELNLISEIKEMIETGKTPWSKEQEQP